MLDSLKSHFSSLHTRAKAFVQHLRVTVRRESKCNRKKSKKSKGLSSNFDLLASSFAASEESNQFIPVFKVIDANGDGKISSHELGEMLLCLGYEKSKAKMEAERMIRVMDCNGDGLVDLDEFINAVKNDGKGSTGSLEDCLWESFLIFDTDRNGLISDKELQKVLFGLGCRSSLEECRLMIKAVDKNGDGFVDFEEFQSMMTASKKINS